MNSNYNGPSGAFDGGSNGPIGASQSDLSSNRPKLPSQPHFGGQNSPAPPPPDPKQLPSQMDYQRPQYTLPGVLHFLQHEWTRFELDRAQWEVERAELQARVAFLQGERKSQESLKVDLVRRIKMLELALRQERQKFARLKSDQEAVGVGGGGEASATTTTAVAGGPVVLVRPTFADFEPEYGLDDLGYGDYLRQNSQSTASAVSGFSWKEGRHLLRQYLKEIGYTDTLISVRSARVRALLGTTGRRMKQAGHEEYNGVGNLDEGHGNGNDDAQREKNLPKSVMDNALIAAENALCATLDSLNPDGFARADEEEDDSDDDDEDADGGGGGGPSPFTSVFQRGRKNRKTIIPSRPPVPPPKSLSNEDMATTVGEADSESALKEFDFLPAEECGGEARSSSDGGSEESWSSSQTSIARMKEEFKNEQKDRRGSQRPKRSHLQDMLSNLKQGEEITDLTSSSQFASNFSSDGVGGGGGGGSSSFPAGGESDTDGTFQLGELAALTVNNDTESASGYDMSAIRDGGMRKTWSTKYTLRSHFDGVRTLAFHPEDLMLMTGSDDGTLKYWNLFRNYNGNKKASSVDFEPVHTFRGHLGPVLTATMNSTGECCISGGADASIRVWNLSCTTGDPYEAYDPAIAGAVLREHTDAVWHLKHHPNQPYMVSCGADARLLWWNTDTMAVLTQIAVPEWGAPTSADLFAGDVARIAASFSRHAAIFDVETGQSVVTLKVPDNPADSVYKLITHPSLPIAITAHEDREIRFFDTNTGALISSMVAHLDAVSALAVDPTGLYLVSGSHDSSVRFWSMDTKTCIQETTIHRRKLDESVFAVACHPTKSHVASAGADGVAKVYT